MSLARERAEYRKCFYKDPIAYQRQVEEARAAFREQDELKRHRRREQRMATSKTRYGPVERPPKIKDDTALDDWLSAIDSALDVARKTQEREAALKSRPTADTARFPVLGGGQ